MWEQLIIAIIVAIVSALLAPKPPKPQDAQLKSPEFPTIEDTEPLIVLFGTKPLKKNNVVWFGDLKTEPIYSESGGKKG